MILYILIGAVISRVQVENISMQPTLHEGQLLMINKLAYRLGDFQHGDIVVFHSDAMAEDLVKRVMGVPGDRIAIRAGKVSVNRETLDEPYLAALPLYKGQRNNAIES